MNDELAAKTETADEGRAASECGGLLTRCCKCGAKDAAVTWHDHKVPYDTHFSQRVADNEHLALSCLRCGYKWNEKPLDKREAC